MILVCVAPCLGEPWPGVEQCFLVWNPSPRVAQDRVHRSGAQSLELSALSRVLTWQQARWLGRPVVRLCMKTVYQPPAHSARWDTEGGGREVSLTPSVDHVLCMYLDASEHPICDQELLSPAPRQPATTKVFFRITAHAARLGARHGECGRLAFTVRVEVIRPRFGASLRPDPYRLRTAVLC